MGRTGQRAEPLEAPPQQVAPWPAPRMLTLSEVAQVLGVQRNTVTKLVAAGTLQVVRLSPRIVRVTREAFDRMIAKGQRAPRA